MALDFPSNPTDGQVYDNFIYSSAKGTWKSLSSGASPNYLVNPTITNAVITATAPNATTVPLTVKGAASQSANLQEWRDSSGTVLANMDQYGSLKTNYTESSIPHISATNSSPANTSYNYILSGANDTGIKAVHFVNSSTRTIDGGANAYTIRNNGGPLVLGSSSYDTTIYNKVLMPNQPAFSAYASSGSIAANQIMPYNTAVINRGGHYNTSTYRFTAPVAGIYLFSVYDIGQTSGTSRFSLYRNGSSTEDSLTHQLRGSNGANFTTATSFWTISASAGDYFSVYVYETGSYGTVEYAWFQGFLIG